MPTTLTKSRFKAYIQQAGQCIYCELPMWLVNADIFAKTYQITVKQAKTFQCTAEHLIARQNGGNDGENNIAAACNYCNQKRHKRKKPLNSIAFKQHVMKRQAPGRWHSNATNRLFGEPSQRFPDFSFSAFHDFCNFQLAISSPLRNSHHSQPPNLPIIACLEP